MRCTSPNGGIAQQASVFASSHASPVTLDTLTWHRTYRCSVIAFNGSQTHSSTAWTDVFNLPRMPRHPTTPTGFVHLSCTGATGRLMGYDPTAEYGASFFLINATTDKFVMQRASHFRGSWAGSLRAPARWARRDHVLYATLSFNGIKGVAKKRISCNGAAHG